MLIHITRHGQPAVDGLPPGSDHQYPPGDPVLTALGRRQAELLGERLAMLEFHGPVFSSPYRRTLETAELIAAQTGTLVRPERALQEWVHAVEFPAFEGLTLERIRAEYTRIAPDAELPYPWFFRGPENDPEVRERVRPFLQWLLSQPYEEVLLVGHGASTGACHRLLAPAATDTGKPANDVSANWNCSLTTIEVSVIGEGRLLRFCDTDHLPDEAVTSNALRYLDAASAS